MGLLGGVPVLFLFQVGLNLFYMDTIEQIKKLIEINKRGVNYIGICPFHKEKSPSFVISESKDCYMCFSCNKKGTLSQLLVELKEMKK